MENNKTEKSFSLIEMIVAMAVFSLVLGSVIGIFVSAIRTQTETLAFQKILDEASYSMEYMGRAIRMAQKDYGGSCVATAGTNYGDGAAPMTYIKFLNYETPPEGPKCQEFGLESSRLYEKKPSPTGQSIPLTSSNFQVPSINFNIMGDAVSGSPPTPDPLQPRVTISFTVQKPDGTSKFQIQTTVSQRNLDI